MTIFKRGPLRANKPFAGKFAKDWKKLLKIVSLEKNLALQAQSSALKISDSTYLQMKTQILNQCF